MAATVKEAVLRHLQEVKIDPDVRIRLRYQKFKRMGVFTES